MVDRSNLANALLARFLKAGVLDGPIYCAEVGARKPLALEMTREPFYRLLHHRILVFEADPVEAERLVNRLCEDSNIEVVSSALGSRDGIGTLYLTKQPKCSSLYQPSDAVISRYQLKEMQLERTIAVQLTTLDLVRESRKWPRVDLVKMDVQGAELDIIKGATATLDNTVAIITEVSFQPIYLGQPLFGDIAAALQEKGFEFYRFIQLGGRARSATVSGQTQTIWGDALFLRTPETVSLELAGRLAVLATLYDALDVADVAVARASLQVAKWFSAEVRPKPPRRYTVAITAVRRAFGAILCRLRGG